MFEFLLDEHSLYSLFKIHWLIIILAVIFLYVKNVIKSPLYHVTRAQKTYFFLAMFLALLIKCTPIDVLGSYYFFSIHVFQMSFAYFVIIPLIILSLPVNFLRKYIWGHRTKFALNVLAHPWLTLVAFNGLLTLYLIPAMFNLIHMNIVAVYIVQAILLMSAFFMWWVIIYPVPEIRGFGYLMRALYIFLASVALFPIGFFYVIIQNEHFPMYIETAGLILTSFTPVYDQQAAGGILKIIQLASYSLALLFILFKWGGQEEDKVGTVDDESIRYVRGVVIHLDKKK